MVNINAQKKFENEFKILLDEKKVDGNREFKISNVSAVTRKNSNTDISKLISCSKNYYEDLLKIYFENEFVCMIDEDTKLSFDGNGILYLIVEKDCTLELEYISKNFNSSFVKILVKKNINLNVILYSDSNFGWNNVEFFLEQSSNVIVSEIVFGAKLFHVNANLEKDAKYDLKSAYFLKESESYILNKVVHIGENSISNIDVSGAVTKNSKVISEGFANILRLAVKSSANQNLNGLILDNTSSISGEPTLKIDNSQVKCSHGFSVSQISEEILFYMSSRGISKENAIWLVVGGFFGKALELQSYRDAETQSCRDAELEKIYKKYLKLVEEKFE